MILAIDIGNTNIVLGGFEGETILFIERISTNRQATTLEFSVSIRTILQLNAVDASAIDGAILSSVVPSLTTVLSHAVQKTVQVTPLVVSPGIKTGLSICVDHPEQVGSDRVVDAVAAAAASAEMPRSAAIFFATNGTRLGSLRRPLNGSGAI